MDNLISTDFRESLTSLLLSIVLIPKTVWRILVEPTWACYYVERQSKNKNENRYHDYSHPVFLFFVVAVLPLALLVPMLVSVLKRNAGLIINFTGFYQYQLNFTRDISDVLVEGFSIIDNLNLSTKIVGLFIVLASLPIASSSVIQLFRGKSFMVNALKPILFIQCYFFAMIFLYHFIVFGLLLFVGKWPSLQTQYVFLFLPQLYFIWGELEIIRVLVKCSYLKSSFLLVLIFLFGIVLMAISEVIVLLPIFIWHFTHLSHAK